MLKLFKNTKKNIIGKQDNNIKTTQLDYIYIYNNYLESIQNSDQKKKELVCKVWQN